jgi:dynein heavy chain
MSFFEMIVPTVDTVRNSYIVDLLLKTKRNVAIVGATGTGKTILAQALLRDLPQDKFSNLVVNFSAATKVINIHSSVAPFAIFCCFDE